MSSVVERIRWGAERRLEFIEFRAFWDGGVNRGEITDRFGVSVPQASSDLGLYQKLAPDNLIYDASQKRYIAAPGFVPRFLKPSADHYLMQLRSIAERVIDLGDTWMVRAPDADAMPIPQARVSPQILKKILATVRLRESIEIQYQSMSPRHPDLMWRAISPHAFGYDGVRWHVRAFCHIDNRFKDFLLSRCVAVRQSAQTAASSSDDSAWNEFFDVVLKPHVGLSASQQSAISLDYNMVHGEMHVAVRFALLFYFNKRLRLDQARDDADPQQNPLMVKNRDEFDAALRRAVS
jgi:hypothetical protein